MEEFPGDPSPRDIEKLREERRARNKLKRLHRKEEKRGKNVEVKSGNVNKGVAMVSRDFLEGFKRKLEEPETGRLRRRHPIVLDIDVETKRVENKITENQIKKSDTALKKNQFTNGDKTVLSGNRLDSSQPTRYKGKHREFEKTKKLSKLKKKLVECNESSTNLSESKHFNYCTNAITDTLEECCGIFVKRIVELQEKLYKRDPHKGDYKRRYFLGFHELKKYLVVNKIKIIIFAKDLRICEENDPLHSQVKEIIDLADKFDTPYVFALNRRTLGALTLKFLPISCIGVRDYDGANVEFKSVLEELLSTKCTSAESAATVSDDTNETLLRKLKEDLVIK